MKKVDRFFTGLVLAGLCSWASADALQVRSMAAACAACHGTHGVAVKGMDDLAGAKKETLLKRMHDYKSGTRSATVMHQLAKGYSDEQIEQLATYYAELKN